MAAFTFGYQDTSGKGGGGKGGIGSRIVSKIISARKLAEQEYEYAQNQAEKYQTSLQEAGIERGYFFKKALQWEFGGETVVNKVSAYTKKKGYINDLITGKSKGRPLSKSDKATLFAKIFEKERPVSFRDQFKKLYQGYVQDPSLEPQDTAIPTEKTVRKQKEGGSKRVSKEQLLSSLQDIVSSIESVAASIGQSSSEVSRGIIQSNIIQSSLADELKLRNNTLESKLDDIVSAINNQTQTEENIAQDQKKSVAEASLEGVSDTARTTAFDDLTTKEEEDLLPSENVDDDQIRPQSPMVPSPAASVAGGMANELAGMEAYGYPKFETGGIISGPDDGYLVELHGDEMIVPLDNKYTRGQPSAVDGKVRPKPSVPQSFPSVKKAKQSFEVGSSSVGGKFGFQFTNFNAITGNAQQPLVDAMSLPMMVAGGTTLAATTQLVNDISASLGPSAGNMSSVINQLSAPIASVFGLPPAIVRASTATSGETRSKEKSEDGKISIFEKMKDGFKSFMDTLGKKVNDEMDDPSPTGGPGGGSGAGGTGKDFATLATIAALESGSAQGRADVAQSVYNRLADGTYGSSITDILTRQGQYQVAFKDPKATSGAGTAVAEEFKNITDENSAVKAIMYYYKARGQSITEAKARKMYRESGSAISDPALQAKAAKHVGGRTEFLSSGQYKAGDAWRGGGSDNTFFARYGSGNQMRRGAVAAPSGLFNTDSGSGNSANKPKPKDLGQSITSNYGMKTHDRFRFTRGDKVYNAYKTTVGFDFYEGNRKVTDPQELKLVIDAFKEKRTDVLSSASAPPEQKKRVEDASAVSKSLNGNGAQIIQLNNIQQQQAKVSSNTPLPTVQNSALRQASNPLNDGIYSYTPLVG